MESADSIFGPRHPVERRTFMAMIAGGLLAAPLAAQAQQPGRVYRVGFLSISTGGYETNSQHCPLKGGPSWQAWLKGLRELGYTHGQNLVIECRYTEGREEQAPALATELVSLKPDLLVATGTVQVLAAKQATSTLPILMVGVIEPVNRGLVASLARPGGNVTGLAETAGMEIAGKRLQLLKEAVPKVSRVAVFSHVTSASDAAYRREIEAAARPLGVKLQFYSVRRPEEFGGAFTGMSKAGADALFVVPNPAWAIQVQRIIELAAQSRLPAMYPGGGFATAGGLMSYGVDAADSFRRLALYVHKILKGAKPADLPVEQPTKFELVINLKTAKALGLTIPPSLLTLADEVIQ